MPISLPMNPLIHTFSEVLALIWSHQRQFVSGLSPEYRVLEDRDGVRQLVQLALRITHEVIEISYLQQ